MVVIGILVAIIVVFIAILLVRDHRSRAGGEVEHRSGDKPRNIRSDVYTRRYMPDSADPDRRNKP